MDGQLSPITLIYDRKSICTPELGQVSKFHNIIPISARSAMKSPVNVSSTKHGTYAHLVSAQSVFIAR